MVTDNLFCLFYRLAFDHASPQDAGTDDEGLHDCQLSSTDVEVDVLLL